MEYIEPLRIPENAVARRLRGVIGSAIRDGVLEEIEAAKRSGEQTELILLIDSPGGDSQFGIELYEMLTEACKSRVLSLTTCNINRTESSAVCIYCAGQKRCYNEKTSFLLHEASFTRFGHERWTATRIREEVIPMLQMQAENLERQTGRFADIIAATTGRPREEIAKLLADGTTLRGLDAERMGLANKRVFFTGPGEFEAVKTYGQPYDPMQCT